MPITMRPSGCPGPRALSSSSWHPGTHLRGGGRGAAEEGERGAGSLLGLPRGTQVWISGGGGRGEGAADEEEGGSGAQLHPPRNCQVRFGRQREGGTRRSMTPG